MNRPRIFIFLLKHWYFKPATLVWASRLLQAHCSFLFSPSMLYFLTTVPLGFSLCYNLQHLSSTALRTTSLCPTQTRPPPPLIEMGITTPDFLLACTGGAEGKRRSRTGSLTSREDHAGMLISIYFNLQPAGEAFRQNTAIHHQSSTPSCKI